MAVANTFEVTPEQVAALCPQNQENCIVCRQVLEAQAAEAADNSQTSDAPTSEFAGLSTNELYDLQAEARQAVWNSEDEIYTLNNRLTEEQETLDSHRTRINAINEAIANFDYDQPFTSKEQANEWVERTFNGSMYSTPVVVSAGDGNFAVVVVYDYGFGDVSMYRWNGPEATSQLIEMPTS